MQDQTPSTLSGQAKALCDAHVCPNCHKTDHVDSELLLVGTEVMVRCHCRVCNYSWHTTKLKDAPQASE